MIAMRSIPGSDHILFNAYIMADKNVLNISLKLDILYDMWH